MPSEETYSTPEFNDFAAARKLYHTGEGAVLRKLNALRRLFTQGPANC